MRRSVLIALPLLVAASASAARAQPQVPDWRLATTPILTLEDNGTPATEFNRVAGAWRLPNGRVVIANGGSSELRIFDPNGALVETLGRRGKGPGEFETMSVVGVSADTAIIYDFATRRATTVQFGAKARVLTMVTMMAAGSGSGFEVTGRLSDGRWVATMGMGSPGGWDAPRGVHRVKGTVALVAPDGTGSIERVAEVESMASITYMPGADKSKWATGPAAFSPWYRGQVSGGVLWFGESGSDSLVRLDARGNRRGIALALPSVAPSPQLVAAAREAELPAALQPRTGDYMNFKYSAENLPSRLPYFAGLLAGADGELWVQEYPATPSAAARYLVLDEKGRPIGRVLAPPRLRATHAGRDFVVGVTRDADDVEGVAILRLERR